MENKLATVDIICVRERRGSTRSGQSRDRPGRHRPHHAGHACDKLIAELRAKPEFRELPVLVVTEHPGDLKPELRQGRTVVLQKPFELDDFIGWIDAAARISRARN